MNTELAIYSCSCCARNLCDVTSACA